ncbi:hypothetical protein AcW2_000402 [Taiwanofungus camphoratus]|nr:hypothetical protein AcW2_000402 [Antrodia cinnamomea]
MQPRGKALTASHGLLHRLTRGGGFHCLKNSRSQAIQGPASSGCRQKTQLTTGTDDMSPSTYIIAVHARQRIACAALAGENKNGEPADT